MVLMVARFRSVLLGLLMACSCEARGLRISTAVDYDLGKVVLHGDVVAQRGGARRRRKH
jgi:hypothetical protein